MTYRRIIVVASALALAACSSSHVDNPTVNAPPSVPVTGTAGATSSLPDPCALLTTAQVTSAFGGAVTSGTSPSPAIRQECDWTVVGSNAGTDGKVVVFYPQVQTSAAFDAAKAGLPGATTVPELGDDAYYVAATASLTVLVGEHQFSAQGVFGRSADAGDLQADLIAVAQLAETHL